jgi:tetratricopeptide (TPR) repeat protein
LNKSGIKSLHIDCQLDRLSKGTDFFFQWIETSLPDKYKETIKADLGYYSKLIENKEVKDLKALKFPKEALDALFQAAKGALVEDIPEEGLSLFQILVTLLPDSYDVWLGLGIAYQKNQQHQQAILAFEEAKKIRQDLFYPSLYQAENYLYLQDFIECREKCEEAHLLISLGDRQFLGHVEALLTLCNQKETL